jgi:hypothetical protein
VACFCSTFIDPLEARALALNLAQNFIPVCVPSLKDCLHALQLPFGFPRAAAVSAQFFYKEYASGNPLLTLANVAVSPRKRVPLNRCVGHV